MFALETVLELVGGAWVTALVSASTVEKGFNDAVGRFIAVGRFTIRSALIRRHCWLDCGSAMTVRSRRGWANVMSVGIEPRLAIMRISRRF